MITYQDNTNRAYYDFKTLAVILRVNPSYLKRAIGKYEFTEKDFIRYNNKHLYAENAVVDFIVYLAKEKLNTELNKTERAAQKMKPIHE